MEFSLYPITRKAKFKYCLIPKSPIRFQFKPKEKPDTYYNSDISQADSITGSTQYNSRLGSTQSNSILDSTQSYSKAGSSQLNSAMGSALTNSKTGRTYFRMGDFPPNFMDYSNLGSSIDDNSLNVQQFDEMGSTQLNSIMGSTYLDFELDDFLPNAIGNSDFGSPNDDNSLNTQQFYEMGSTHFNSVMGRSHYSEVSNFWSHKNFEQNFK